MKGVIDTKSPQYGNNIEHRPVTEDYREPTSFKIGRNHLLNEHVCGRRKCYQPVASQKLPKLGLRETFIRFSCDHNPSQPIL
jgi:hypothetical protein